jgi:hypothetical protein
MGRVLTVLLALMMCTFAARAHARAPDTFEEDYAERVLIDSPQWFAFEMRFGPYKPALRSRRETFDNDSGWLMNLEVDFTLWHIPYDIGQVNLAGVFGWSSYDAYARLRAMPEERSGEKTEFTIFPLAALAVLRIDALARHTVVPVTFAAKMGYEWVRWKVETGAEGKQAGFNRGFRYALQAALELDFFNQDAARSLDEDFGINHTYLLFEYMDSQTKATGDNAFMFGLGAQF